MGKDIKNTITLFSLIIVSSVVIFIYLAIITSTHTETVEKKQQIKEPEISIIKIPSFLKNTTYIYNDRLNVSRLIDYSYTPEQRYTLKKITIEIKDNIMVIGTNCYLRHKILSAEYYSVVNQGLATNVAVIHTDKGLVVLTEIRNNYSCWIKYGDKEAEGGGGDLARNAYRHIYESNKL